jgi:hypothetical protein
MKFRLATLLALLTTGCVPAFDGPPYMHLIDQRSFASGPIATKDARVLPKLPLATIRFSSPNTEFAHDLDNAVDAARDRKPEAEFDVIIPLPPNASPSEAMQRHATEVAHEIAERGISTDRIHIGIAQDQGAPPGELRIFVR